ncbi:MAG: zinc ribbon domain-containing protein [Syntrophobacteraceae bacterium]
MFEQLKHLVELQLLEDKRRELIRGFEATPKRIADLEKECERFEGTFLAKKAELEHARKMRRALEQEIADQETKIVRSKTRMNEVKTNKEYQAILKEIEDIKKEIGGKEDEALDYMEKIEILGKQVKVEEKELSGNKERIEAEKKQLLAESERIKERLDRLDAIVRKVRDLVEPVLLKRSDFLLQRQAGIAVAACDGGVCQVCHLNIPPQKFIELMKDESIMECPHCHRFLYWPGNEAYTIFEEDLDAI